MKSATTTITTKQIKSNQIMAAIGNIHHIRVVRFLLVVSLATLTIFIYASYSSNTPLTPPQSPLQPQPHALRSIIDQQQLIAANKSIDAAAGVLTAFGNNGIDSIGGGGGGGDQNGNDSSLLKLNRKAAVISAGGTSGGVGSSNGDGSAKLPPSQNAAAAPAANIAKKQHQHREPTIDVDAINDEGGQHDEAPDEDELERFGNELLEDGDVQNIDNALVVGSINNSNTSSAQQNNNGAAPQEQSKPQLDQQQKQANEEKAGVDNGNNNADKIFDTDVMIPTSNLQKFIENADKILKNITGSAPTNDQPDNKVIPHINVEHAKDSNNNKKPLPEKDKTKGEAEKDSSGGGDAALPPSVVMTIKRPDQQQQPQPQQQPQKPLPKQQQPQQKPTDSHTSIKIPIKSPLPLNNTDHSKGIPMTEIYESGHLNDEINTAIVCPKNGDELKLLILISSAPTHTEARLAIRQTWAHYGTRRDVSIGFVLGRTTNESIHKELSIENFIYGDMIRGNFIDSYSNLTLKTISTLEWIDLHCSHAKYILKTDDDMFINVPKLLQFIDGHAKQKRVIYGRLAKNWKPIRNKKSKYYVSNEQFSQAVFPAFTTGPAYLFTNDIVHELYERSLQQVYLKLEDVFTTGIVAQQLGIKRLHANEFLNRRVAFNPCNIRKLISVHMIKANEQFDLWKKLLDKSTKCK